MAITIEGYSVVVKKDLMIPLLESETVVPFNRMYLADDDYWRCSFMAESDAQEFARKLESAGLNVSKGPDPDGILVSEFHLEIHPYCEWFQVARWEKAVIGWKAGTRPDSIVAREGFDPKVGSGLHFHDPNQMENLEFVRLDGNVEVYLNKETGEEVFLGRTETPLDALFTEATETIRKHFRTAGEPVVIGEAAKEVAEAKEQLLRILKESPDAWRVHFFLGKGQIALGDLENAYSSFQRAMELEKNVEWIPRELGGVCLELGKFDEAIGIANHAASLEPDNPETLGNVGLTFLMAGRVPEAQKTIASALKIRPTDKINQKLERLIEEVASGQRPQPKSMADLRKKKLRPAGPAGEGRKQAKKFWQFWRKD